MFLKVIFTWWNKQTVGTFLKTLFTGNYVGKDSFGNKYYKNKKNVSTPATTKIIKLDEDVKTIELEDTIFYGQSGGDQGEYITSEVEIPLLASTGQWDVYIYDYVSENYLVLENGFTVQEQIYISSIFPSEFYTGSGEQVFYVVFLSVCLALAYLQVLHFFFPLLFQLSQNFLWQNKLIKNLNY